MSFPNLASQCVLMTRYVWCIFSAMTNSCIFLTFLIPDNIRWRSHIVGLLQNSVFIPGRKTILKITKHTSIAFYLSASSPYYTTACRQFLPEKRGQIKDQRWKPSGHHRTECDAISWKSSCSCYLGITTTKLQVGTGTVTSTSCSAAHHLPSS